MASMMDSTKHNRSQTKKTETGRTPPNSSYDARIILIPKADTDIRRRVHHRPISFVNLGEGKWHQVDDVSLQQDSDEKS